MNIVSFEWKCFFLEKDTIEKILAYLFGVDQQDMLGLSVLLRC